MLIGLQSSEDTVYEQDILRDPGSVRPWLAYVDFKMQNGTLHEKAFVSCRIELWGKWGTLTGHRFWNAPAYSYLGLTSYGKWYAAWSISFESGSNSYYSTLISGRNI